MVNACEGHYLVGRGKASRQYHGPGCTFLKVSLSRDAKVEVGV